MAYAEVFDLEYRWHELTEDEQARAEVLLEDASAYIDSLVDADKCNHDVLKIVCCIMVQRAMVATDANALGITQQSMTAGPYTQSWTYSNPSGDFFLTKLEKKLLGISPGYIGSIRPMIGGKHDNWH